MKNEPVDVCIVGSGAAGGTLCLALAEAGFKVVVLEAGPWWNPARDYYHDTRVMEKRFKWQMPTVSEGERISKEHHNSYGVGGGMNHWSGAVGRFEEEDFRLKTLEGQGEDWPYAYADLVPFYRLAEKQLGVSGTTEGIPKGYVRGEFPNPAHKLFYASQILKRGFDKLGFTCYPGAVAINSRPYEDRPACNYCGGCNLGCPIGAKANTLITHFPKAIKQGGEVRPKCYATEITVDSNGKAKSVVYLDEKRQRQEQEARIIIVAGWTIQTPRLLLNSVSAKFPQGLGNSSGLLGKYLMCVIGGRITGIFDEVIDGFRGFTLNNLESRHFYKTDAKNGYLGGFTYEATSVRYPTKYVDRAGPLWGKDLLEHMKTFRRHYELAPWGRPTCSAENRVTLDPAVKDRHGLPVAKVVYHWSDNDKKMHQAMQQRGKEIFEAAGAASITGTPSINGAYWFGGIRMGNDPANSVVDSYGRSHDVKNLFVAGPSMIPSGVAIQPTLTIVAMSLRTADHIVRNRRDL